MGKDDDTPARVRWARLRFSIVGPLLHSPPEAGEVRARIEELARRPWRHPHTGEAVHFSFKTIERWYYMARESPEPIVALERKVPKHAGTHPSVSAAVAEAIARQHADHPRWSYQLHHDNLAALAREDPRLLPLAGYASLTRYMKANGFCRARRRARRGVEPTFVPRETRSFEVEHVHGLWHLDFHEGSRPLLTSDGTYRKPKLLGILDDRSRLCCHLQWYWEEDTEALVHGLSQAIQKRGLPRALLTDNGTPMIAAETAEGLARLSVVHNTTLPAHPEQNGKQEHFWTRIEGRLLAMLEGEPTLTLEVLNVATQAWVEQEYHHQEHSEIKDTPLARYLRGPSVGRPSPSSDQLRRVFRTEVTRIQRRSDGTVTVEGVRYEIPNAYRTLPKLRLRVARWDLSTIDLVDPRAGTHLATLYPLDKARNADAVRRVLPAAAAPRPVRPAPGIAPHLRSLMAEYAATGLPPAFLPKDTSDYAARSDDDSIEEDGDSDE
jgi:putative transposase